MVEASKQASKQVSKQASKQASKQTTTTKQASKQHNEQASRPASKQASGPTRRPRGPDGRRALANKQASKQASKQAGKQASERASKQASKQASKEASKQASKQASRRASKQASPGDVDGEWIKINSTGISRLSPVCCGYDHSHFLNNPSQCGNQTYKDVTFFKGRTDGFYNHMGGNACARRCAKFVDQYEWSSPAVRENPWSD